MEDFDEQETHRGDRRDSDWRWSSDRRSQFRSAPPPQLQTGRYANDYMETMDLGELNSALRPWDRADVARYFAAAAVHVRSQAASQVMTQKGTSISENARIFALIATAVSDGLPVALEAGRVAPNSP
jgi:hypothetical protein